MCYKIKSGKWTWNGCGKHIAQDLKDIPVSNRCKCVQENNNTIPPLYFPRAPY